MLALSMPGGAEWIVILIIALLIFGPRLPSVMRNLGKSVNEFKKGMRETEDEFTKSDSEDAAKKPEKEIKG